MTAPGLHDENAGQVMGKMPYGHYIIGSCDEAGEPNGMMADWVTQVSFEPRLLAVAFENDAHTLANIRAAGVFTVNFLEADEGGRKLGASFGQPYFGSKIMGRSAAEKAVIHHKLPDVPHALTARGCPILDGALAWLECEAAQSFPVGDHTLVVARVLNGKVVGSAEPLTTLYTGWTYSS